jgi:uncharacterized protein YbjT (DUF2867 family)
MQKTVVLAGATGLVGSRLLELLLKDITVKEVLVLGRREPDVQHTRLRYIQTSFIDLKSLLPQVQGAEVLYCTVGTTIRKAGSKEAFRNVDYGIPLFLAGLASEAGIKSLVIISSLGADAGSSNFYLRTKGEMERDISNRYRFRKLAFVRPSLLLGPREEFRLGERIGQFLMVAFSFLLRGRRKKYRPILDETVAKAMIAVSGSINNQMVYESDELQWLGK